MKIASRIERHCNSTLTRFPPSILFTKILSTFLSFSSPVLYFLRPQRVSSPFIKIPLKLSPLLLFLETKRISPPARINKIREEEEGRREEEKEDGARILSSFPSLKRIIYQSPISKSEDTSCDPLGHPWSEQGLDTNRGTRGLARK